MEPFHFHLGDGDRELSSDRPNNTRLCFMFLSCHHAFWGSTVPMGQNISHKTEVKHLLNASKYGIIFFYDSIPTTHYAYNKSLPIII